MSGGEAVRPAPPARPSAGDRGLEAAPSLGREFVLGLDLDNVCADYDAAFRAHVAKAFGVEESSLGVVDDWDFTKVGWGIGSREHFESLHAQAVRAGMFRTMPVMEGASRALWRLSDAGIHIRIITHRLFIKGLHERSASDTIAWLDDVNLPYRDICMIADKVKVGADLYLDDGPHNITALRRDGAEAVVFDQPYNRHLDGARVRNWDEAAEHVLARARAVGATLTERPVR